MVLTGAHRSPEEIVAAAALSMYPSTRLAVCLQKEGGRKTLRCIRYESSCKSGSSFRCL